MMLKMSRNTSAAVLANCTLMDKISCEIKKPLLPDPSLKYVYVFYLDERLVHPRRWSKELLEATPQDFILEQKERVQILYVAYVKPQVVIP